MADSLREKIIQNLILTLQGITKTAGYDFDMQTVLRLPKTLFEIHEFPAVMLTGLSEDKLDGRPVQKTTCNLHIDLLLFAYDYDELSQAANVLLANTEKALKVDITRGGNAYDTNLVSNTLYTSEELQPYGGVGLLIDILYRHDLTNPFSQ